MVELDSHRAPVTWDELVKTKPEVTEDWEAMKRYRQEQGIEIHYARATDRYTRLQPVRQHLATKSRAPTWVSSWPC